jgi:hypothetical protein
MSEGIQSIEVILLDYSNRQEGSLKRLRQKSSRRCTARGLLRSYYTERFDELTLASVIRQQQERPIVGQVLETLHIYREFWRGIKPCGLEFTTDVPPRIRRAETTS